MAVKSLFLDVTTEQLERNTALQSCNHFAASSTRRGHYIRIRLQEQSAEQLKQNLIAITIEECVERVLKTKRQHLSQADVPFEYLREQMQNRLADLMPQLKLMVDHDIEQFISFDVLEPIPSWNIEGYLQFSAKKLKWVVQTVLDELYQAYIEEQERAEFIALLQFCVAAQPSILEDVYLTVYPDRFIMLDIWGNDLQQIYLDALPKEEYANVHMHDLILSILMTMLPQNIHLFIAYDAMHGEQKKLVRLLQQIFAERILIEQI